MGNRGRTVTVRRTARHVLTEQMEDRGFRPYPNRLDLRRHQLGHQLSSASRNSRAVPRRRVRTCQFTKAL